jgi:hypothetical protein
MRNGVRALAGALLLVGLTPVVAPARPAAAASDDSVTAIFECAFHDSSGWVTVWGYDNSSDEVQSEDVRATNHFTQDQDSGQPTTFEPGRHDNVVVVPWDGTSNLQWHLQMSKDDASTSETCATNPVPITGTGLSSIVGIGLLAAVGVALDYFLRRRRARSTKS